MSAVLWCGGEDIDFPNGAAVTLLTSGGAQFRTGYARCSVYDNGATTTSSRSLAFSGGAITTCWLHFFVDISAVNSLRFCGLGQIAGAQFAIGVGNDATTATKLALWKYSGGTYTSLATEAGSSLIGGQSTQIDMHLQNFGATATVDVYINGSNTPVISYSGSTTVTGVTTLDCVAVPGNGGSIAAVSEIIVTDSLDTRSLSVVTHAPNAAGDSVGSWTGTFASINPVTINDATFINNNAVGSDFQANLINLPTGTFQCYAAKAVARGAVPAGSTTVGFKLGIKSGGTVNVDGGHTCSTAFQPFERLMLTNPVSAVAFTSADLNALQLDIQSQ